MTSTTIRETILEWLKGFLAQSERSRDDLHVDQISGEFKDPSMWAEAAVQCFRIAAHAARAEGLPVTVAMEFFLEAGQSAEGFQGGRIRDLALSWTPPALTAYRKGAEPWKTSAAYKPVAADTGLPVSDKVTTLFQEWFDEADGDYDRRLWLVAE